MLATSTRKVWYSLFKGPQWIQWDVAHPLTLNNRAHIISVDAIMCVSDEGTSYVHSVLTHMVAFTEMIGAPLFNVNGSATSHWIPLRAFLQENSWQKHMFLICIDNRPAGDDIHQ